MMLRLLTWFAVAARFSASAHCDTWTGCDACTRASSWMPGTHCSWCPQDHQCHDYLSAVNPCGMSELIHDPKKCTDPAPTPPPPVPIHANSTKFLRAALTALFAKLKISDVNVDACATDLAGSTVSLKDFAGDVSAKQYSSAVVDLSRGLSSLSRSTSSCGVPEVQQKLDALATSVRWAHISTGWFDRSVKVVVDASDLWQDLDAVAVAVKGNDPSVVGDKIGALLSGWTAVTGGCNGNQACELVDGILRVLQVGAKDAKPCQTSLTPAVTKITAAITSFDNKDYKAAVGSFADGLEVIAQATKSDSCGLKPLADAIGDLSSSLKAAVVKTESSGAVRIAVGSADVYNALYGAVADLKRSDFAGAGVQMGVLLAQLQASGCKSKTCIVVQGILSTLQLGFTNFKGCENDLDTMWDSFEVFFRHLRLKEWKDAFHKLGDILGTLKTVLGDCQVKNFGDIFETTATKLHADSIATDIGQVVQFLTNGADVSADVQKVMLDFENEDWAAVGKDIGHFADWVNNTDRCNSFVCKVVEGVLQEVDVSLQDLKPCQAKLREGETDFTAGAALWAKGDVKNAVQSWGAGLNAMSQAVSACDLTQKLGWIEQEANVLGLANHTSIGDIAKLLVHGSDFYEDLYASLIDIQNGDYRSAGGKMTKVMNDMSTWTTGHLCTSPVCYVVNGIMQYMTELEGDIRACKNDLTTAWVDFGDAFQHLSGHASIFSAFSNSTRNVTQGMTDLGNAMNAVANSVGHCHLQELASLIAALAAKFMIQPEFEWLETFLKILIDGVQIEKEVASACIDFGRHDWPGFGYNLIKLVKTLIEHPPAQSSLQTPMLAQVVV